MQKHSVQDLGSFVGELVDDLLRRNLDQLGRGRPVGLGEHQCPFWWRRALTWSMKWSNGAFPFQNITPEIPSPDDSPSPKPCVPRCLWPGPSLGHQSLPADVWGQYMFGHCGDISDVVISCLVFLDNSIIPMGPPPFLHEVGCCLLHLNNCRFTRQMMVMLVPSVRAC